MKNIFHFFDKLEDHARARLSKHNILYAFIGGVSIVLFWRGVWMIADGIPFLTGVVSVIISVAVLLVIGLFVSFFVGDEIIISGVKNEKKLNEKVASEIKTELDLLKDIHERLERIEKKLGE